MSKVTPPEVQDAAAQGCIIGLLRVRNEEDIILDTLDHLSTFCTGGIFVYDDASTDLTSRLCSGHRAVREVVQGDRWDTDRERAAYEGRAAVLAAARVHARPEDWFVYTNADERIEYDWNRLQCHPRDVIAVRMKLLDFYITPQDVDRPFTERQWLGPEFRYVLMAFRNLPTLAYRTADQRDLDLGTRGRIAYEGWVRHYGKALSVGRWERKCDYCAGSSPKYSAEWSMRRGRAVHEQSDFGAELITWNERNTKSYLLGLHPEDSDPAASGGGWPLRILLTNHHLQNFGGTETYTLTLATALSQRGHQVTVYSKFAEVLAPELARRGLALATDLDAVKQSVFDVAHVHHNVCAYEVRHCFPELPLVFVSHGVLPFLESPPIVDLGISRFVAVSEEVAEHLVQEGVAQERLRLCRNVVDEELFSPPLTPLPERPRRAFVLSNRIDPTTEAAIRDACERSGIQCLVMGARSTPVDYSELPALVRCADLVFTLGRGAVETMLCGRIPFILDINGGDGLVTPDNVREIMRCNLSGRRFGRRFDADAILTELEAWRPENGPALRKIAAIEFGASARAAELEGIYRQAISEGLPSNLCRTATDLTRTVVESVRETLGQTHSLWLSRNSAQGVDRLARLENLANVLLSGGWLDASRAVLESLLGESPGHVLATAALAYITVIEGRHAEANGLLQRALAREPDHPTLRQMLDFLRSECERKAAVSLDRHP